MRIYIASDHAGFELKGKLTSFIKDVLSHEVIDEGPYEYNAGDDFSDFVVPLVKRIVDEGSGMGIVIGKSGQGEAMQANRYKNIRAAVYYGGNLEIVKLSREHNDSNVLSLAAGFLSEDDAKEAVRIWLATAFSGDERHERRINKMDTKN